MAEGAGGSHWPLHGRDDDLDRVLEVVLARTTRPSGAVIGGPAGIGKTRLATEATQHAERSGWRVHRIHATRSASTVPFGCCAQWLDGTAEGAEPMELLGTLQRLRRQLLADPEGRPLVVMVDDAQHLDEATAALVHQLAVTADARLIVTVRSGSHPPDAISMLWKDELCERLDLAPLTRNDVEGLVDQALGGALDPGSLDRLYDACGGNPLFLREILEDARASGAVVRRRGSWAWTGVSDGVRLAELVAAHLGRLDDVASDLVDLLAVAEPLPLTALDRIVDPPVIAQLEAGGVVVTDQDDQGSDPNGDRVRLAHPLFGEVRRAGMGRARTRLLESRALDALVALGPIPAEDTLRVARWSVRVGAPRPPAELAAAAGLARQGGDLPLAEQLARSAIDGGAGPEVELALAEILEVASRPDAALAVLDGLDDRLTNDELRARARCCSVRLLAHGLHRPDDAELLLTEAPPLADPVWQGFVEAQWATTLAMLGRVREAGERADRLFADPDPRVRLRALLSVHLVALAEGRLEDGLAAAESMVPVCIEHRDDIPQGPNWVVNALTVNLLGLGRLADVDALLAMIAGDPGGAHPGHRAFRLMIEGRLELARGSVRAARAALLESVELFAAGADGQGFLASALGLLVEAAALAGDVEQATEAAEEARLLVAASEPRVLHLDVARSCAWSPLAAGDTAGAVDRLVEAADGCATAGYRTFEAVSLHDAVRLGASRPVQRRLVQVASQVQGTQAAAWVLHGQGLIDDDPASLERSADLLAGLGVRIAAAEVYAAAARRYHEAGLHASARRAGQRLRALTDGLDSANSPRLDLPLDLPALSAREAQVARLAAQGLTSRQIADQLDVSKRTVDNQLGRVYEKLGIAGRSELTAVMAS